MRIAGSAACLALASATFAGLALVPHGTAHAVGPFTMSTAVALPTADGGTEPRYTVVSVGPHPGHYALSNAGGAAKVWESDDGLTGWTVRGSIVQTGATIDVDIVSMPGDSSHPGRLIANELEGTISIVTSYSDDGGVTWTASTLVNSMLNLNGSQFADQDRNWLATGPHDRVYFLFHNLASGTLTHNMFVSTSTDAGATFGAPVPTTTPGTQAWTDLQCADSGGPSNLFVNQQTARVYAVWGSRSSIAGGGCGASVTGNFEINVVAATRVWVATAPEGSTGVGAGLATAWQQSLAVDDNAHPFIVGMQLAPGAIDSAGNLYILYPESLAAYPNYDGAAIKYVHATETDIVANPYGAVGPANQVWSGPLIPVAPSGGAGHLLPHIVAGGPGQIDMAYFEGTETSPPSTTADWFLVTAQTIDALDTNPVFSYWRVKYPRPPLAPIEQAAYSGFTASAMMGACASGPTSATNGFACSRSTDVWGIALDSNGKLQVTWPSASQGNFGCNSSVSVPPPCTSWVASQIDGPMIAPPQPNNNVPETPWAAALIVIGLVSAAGLLRLSRRRKTS
jgi:hypothetical protein